MSEAILVRECMLVHSQLHVGLYRLHELERSCVVHLRNVKVAVELRGIGLVSLIPQSTHNGEGQALGIDCSLLMILLSGFSIH
jgi:hypothetical protein